MRMATFPAAIAIALGVMAPGAHATSFIGTAQTFEFTGDCTDCGPKGGDGVGIGYLTLQDYTLGTSLASLPSSDFVSFTYSSDVIPSLTIPSSDDPSLTGMLGPTFPSPYAVTISDSSNGDYFDATNGGAWCITESGSCTPPGGGALDSGDSSDFSAIPEPMSAALLSAGLFALGLVRRRR